MQLIGVDTGGTFTDVVVIDGDGRLAVGKALSTPGRVEDGVFAALEQAAAVLGHSLPALLAGTDVLAHGTTVGLNALLTGTGARVGLLTTRGFESTLAIAKANKIHDLPGEDLHAPARWAKPDLLVRRGDIAGVGERIDASGAVVEPLDERHAREAIAALAGRGVQSLAVCLLWSPVNPAHERRVRELAGEIAPGLRVTVSSDLASRIGEYERMTTAVIDAYVAPLVSSYLERFEDSLRTLGFRGAFLVMRMGGGVQPAALARRQPVQTLRSGPAGGISAARWLGARDGFPNIIATDVGGTSFDVGLVIGGEPQYARRPAISRLPVATMAVDIESIGTGGGSIAWIDEALGSLRVGPQTAAARPGPACYGLGGTLPTLTDAAVVLGHVTRLGGTLRLNRGAARAAIAGEIAAPLGLDVVTAAEGIVAVACEQMRDLVRRSTIQRGHDPSEFMLVAYGGAGPQYAPRFARDLGVQGILIPQLAGGLSAFGALASQLLVRADRDLRPVPVDQAVGELGRILAELEPGVRDQLRGTSQDGTGQDGDGQDGDGQDGTGQDGTGRGGAALEIRRTVGLRFYRQIHRLDLEIPAGPLTAAVAGDLVRRFHARHELVVGPGTAPPGTPVEAVSVAVEALLPTPVPAFAPRGGPAAGPAGYTSAFFDGVERRCPRYSWPALAGGQRIDGPAFIESPTTTAVLHQGQQAEVTAAGDLFVKTGG
jgi:N-methylhydantoinase A